MGFNSGFKGLTCFFLPFVLSFLTLPLLHDVFPYSSLVFIPKDLIAQFINYSLTLISLFLVPSVCFEVSTIMNGRI